MQPVMVRNQIYVGQVFLVSYTQQLPVDFITVRGCDLVRHIGVTALRYYCSPTQRMRITALDMWLSCKILWKLTLGVKLHHIKWSTPDLASSPGFFVPDVSMSHRYCSQESMGIIHDPLRAVRTSTSWIQSLSYPNYSTNSIWEITIHPKSCILWSDSTSLPKSYNSPPFTSKVHGIDLVFFSSWDLCYGPPGPCSK